VGELQRRARVPLGARRGRRALGLLDPEPAAFRARLRPVEQPARPRQPARGLGEPPVDPVLAREVRGEAAGRAVVATAPVGRVRLAPAIDPRVALAQPPQRAAEPVERVGVIRGLLEGGGERVPRTRPVRLGEALPACRC
jgi:hypothetical protein